MSSVGSVPPSGEIRLMPAKQLVEATDIDDDWTGINNTKERKKRQNRLNQRAYRRRKALESTSDGSDGCSVPTPGLDTQQPPSQSGFYNSTAGLRSNLQLDAYPKSYQGISTSSALIPSDMGQATNPNSFPLSPDHALLPVIALNITRGILTNYSILLAMQTSTSSSSCCSGLGISSMIGTLPESLIPTSLQQRILHFAWIDLFPSPQLRDNLISAFVEGIIDEADLVADLTGNIFDELDCSSPAAQVASEKLIESGSMSKMDEALLVPTGRSNMSAARELGIVAWSDPWLTSGWEITEGFARKWGFLLKGCADVVCAANQWRRRRDEEPLVVGV